MSEIKEEPGKRTAVKLIRAMSRERWQTEVRDTLARAKQLREEVREDLRLKRWGADDMQMERYNVLASKAALLFVENETITNRIIELPDAILQSYGIFYPIQDMPADLPARRIEGRLTILIELLEMSLGETPDDTGTRVDLMRRPRGDTRARIFVSHSGESPAFLRLLRFLWGLGVEPVVAEWLPFTGRLVPQHVAGTMDSCVAAIVFATGVDQVGNRKQPGRGVLIETGILQERFRQRVIYLVEEGTEFGPMADNFAHESFTQDNLERAFGRVVIELKAMGVI